MSNRLAGRDTLARVLYLAGDLLLNIRAEEGPARSRFDSTAGAAPCEMVRRLRRKLWSDAGIKIFSALSGSNFIYTPALEQKGISTALPADFMLLLGTCALVFLIANQSFCSRHCPIHAALRWGRHDDPSRLLMMDISISMMWRTSAGECRSIFIS